MALSRVSGEMCRCVGVTFLDAVVEVVLAVVGLLAEVLQPLGRQVQVPQLGGHGPRAAPGPLHVAATVLQQLLPAILFIHSFIKFIEITWKC